jgi:putative ATP-dependent endonuclease of the OLD family
VLVEGPSDEIIFQRIFEDKYSVSPMALGIDVLSMRGLSLRRCLELCAALDKTVAAIRDNDGAEPGDLRPPIDKWLADKRRELFIGALDLGQTLEPQLICHNDEATLRTILGVHDKADLAVWMKREKTEAALRIAKAEQQIVPPKYMLDAAVFIHE